MNDLKPPRAWLKEEKKMVKADAVNWCDRIVYVKGEAGRFRYNFKEVILLMPTGLQDKNGTEDVYQKDIISYSISDTQHYKGVVEWSEDSCGFVVKAFWQKVWYRDTDSYEAFCSEVHGFSKSGTLNIVILGNEFEHPDLL